MKFNEKITEVISTKRGITLKSDSNVYHSDNLVVTAGPWTRDFLPPTHKNLNKVYRQVVHWFKALDLSIFGTDNFPFVCWIGSQQEEITGIFPRPPGGLPGVKVLTEQFVTESHPDEVSRVVAEREAIGFFDAYCSSKISGIIPECIRSEVCFYTRTPDEHFIIDHHPTSDRILVVSACSGHGFKHSAAIGECVCNLVLNKQENNSILSQFALNRF